MLLPSSLQIIMPIQLLGRHHFCRFSIVGCLHAMEDVVDAGTITLATPGFRRLKHFGLGWKPCRRHGWLITWFSLASHYRFSAGWLARRADFLVVPRPASVDQYWLAEGYWRFSWLAKGHVARMNARLVFSAVDKGRLRRSV